jgi:hypothetical protein
MTFEQFKALLITNNFATRAELMRHALSQVHVGAKKLKLDEETHEAVEELRRE